MRGVYDKSITEGMIFRAETGRFRVANPSTRLVEKTSRYLRGRNCFWFYHAVAIDID